MKDLIRSTGVISALALAMSVQPASGKPLDPAPVAAAHIEDVTYDGKITAQAPLPKGDYRNPILPGFQPDPSILRVGKDFYLVNSTFSWFPGIPIYHSRDLVNWRQIGNAIDRPDQFSFSKNKTNDAIFAPAISYYGGKYRILDTCVRCGGNFILEADKPQGPWSDPIWLDFEGIDASLFVDDDGRAFVVNNGAPEGTPRYEGHRAIWIQQIDLARNKMIGPRKVLVDGGVHPEEKPIWAEGPHIFKRDGWYYLTAAEGGTAENHSQTIYRSRSVEGPYKAGPINPILTQRNLPADRPNRVEATGHADFVKLEDGSWWAVFLGTKPFAGQSTLLGRETFLLPVTWKDGWPLILKSGQSVPLVVKRPNLPADQPVNWTHWHDDFSSGKLGLQWLRLRTPPPGAPWFRLDASGLTMTPRIDTPGSTTGQPAFLGRRMRQDTATMTERLTFVPRQDGDFAGLMAFMNEQHFVALGITGTGKMRRIEVRERSNPGQPETGVVIAKTPLTTTGPVTLRLSIDRGHADFAMRTGKSGPWQMVAKGVDVEHMASVHAGLFTGTVMGPYAQAAQ